MSPDQIQPFYHDLSTLNTVLLIPNSHYGLHDEIGSVDNPVIFWFVVTFDSVNSSIAH